MGTLFSSNRNTDEHQTTPTRSSQQPRTYAPAFSSYTTITAQPSITPVSSRLIAPRMEAQTYSTVTRITTPIQRISALTSSSNVHSESSAAPMVARDYSYDTTLTASYDNTIRKKYGYYECSCGAWWESGHSWANATQDCKQCGEQVYPYRQEDLRPRIDNIDEPKAPHMEDLCGMCRKLGRSCTLIMSASGNARYPNDVVVKGLPMNITEATLREKFREYGTIVRITIPAPRENSYSRIAFITFENREIALERFNINDSSMPKNRKMRMR
jgi:hypothetical protein